MSPTVSVLLPTYNRAELLKRAIDSVLEQTYTDLELIVVDDASTDDTDKVVEDYSDDRVTYVKHDENQNAAVARNTGFEHADGEYIAFLDDDDEWLPEKLEVQMEYFTSLPDSVGMVYCWMDVYDEDTREIVREHHPTYSGDVFEHVIDRQRVGGMPTVVVRREVYEAVGGFDGRIDRGDDSDFIRRIALEYDVEYVGEKLVNVYTDHGLHQSIQETEQSHRDAIYGQRLKLEKFPAELRSLPKKTARVHGNIAYHYGCIGCWRKMATWYGRALQMAPHEPFIYLLLLRNARRLFAIGDE